MDNLFLTNIIETAPSTTEVLETAAAETKPAATVAAVLETTAETLAPAVQEAQAVSLQLADLFTPAQQYLGWWLVGGAALAAIFLTLVIVLVVQACKKKARRHQEASGEIHSTHMPTAGTEAVPIQVGKVHGQGAREYQQDSFAVTPVKSLNRYGVMAVVADGMGGLQNGELVSQTAVRSMIDGFLGSPVRSMDVTLWSLLQSCNEDVNKLLGKSNLKKSGSTLVAGILRGSQFLWVSVGDSRVYLLRDGMLTQLNREHDYLHELRLKAVNGQGTLQEAENHPRKHGLTSYLGRGELKHLDIPAEPLDVRKGDVLLLMSDGVYNAMTKTELMGCLAGTAQDMANALGRLIEEKAHPQQDNYTAVVLKLEAAPEGGA